MPVDVKVEHAVPMKTRDGVTLYCDIYRPDAEGKFPVLVVRIPYDRTQQFYANGLPTLHLAETRNFPKKGFIVVAQDTRGRHASEGDFSPYVWDAADGYDTIEWAAALPWSNGKVATIGKSYMGLTQYLAAGESPPHLQAAAPFSAPVSYFRNCVYRAGVFEMGWQLPYIIGMAKDDIVRQARPDAAERLAELDSYLEDPSIRFSPLKLEEYRRLPVRSWADRLADAAPYLADLLAHPVDGPFWHKLEVPRRAAQIQIPMLHGCSWFDPFLLDTIEMFTAVRAEAKTAEIARAQRMVIGPWTHVYGTRMAGEVDFGPEAELDIEAMQDRWYDHWLKGIDTGLLEEPPVKVFVMGKNRWREAWEWPIAGTRYTPMYLASRGRANSLSGDGRLGFERPGDTPPDRFTYDPDNPVPTKGGTTLLALGMAGGSYDQREVERRPDVLVYTSDPLAEDIEVTGPVKLKLYAATSAPDTDFTAKLVDVHPDGAAYNVADGIVRARFRESLEHPTLVKPGEVVEYTVDLWSTSHMFPAGHHIRLDVSSSDFPRYDRNPNTGNDFGVDVTLKTAQQTVFHDGRYPSHLVLPVIPG